MDHPKSEHSAQTDKGYPHLPTQSGPVSQTYRFQVQSSASGCKAIRSLHHNTGCAVGTADVRSDIPVPHFRRPRRCILRTAGDCRGCQSSLWDTDVVGAEISEVFILLCFGCCGRLWLGGGSLCRCTPEVIDCRPRRNGYVSGRCSPMPVCLGVLWRAFVRTGRRRMSRSQSGCQLDKIYC